MAVIGGTTKPCPGCGRPTSRAKFACRPCWYRLPQDLRRTITDSWGSGDLDTWVEAAEEAKAIYDKDKA